MIQYLNKLYYREIRLKVTKIKFFFRYPHLNPIAKLMQYKLKLF